jgi:hypothetical protein
MVLDRDKLKKLLKEKGVKDLDDFNAVMKDVSKDVIETLLEEELIDHLGFEKHDQKVKVIDNSRNGNTPKNVKSKYCKRHNRKGCRQGREWQRHHPQPRPWLFCGSESFRAWGLRRCPPASGRIPPASPLVDRPVSRSRGSRGVLLGWSRSDPLCSPYSFERSPPKCRP